MERKQHANTTVRGDIAEGLREIRLGIHERLKRKFYFFLNSGSNTVFANVFSNKIFEEVELFESVFTRLKTFSVCKKKDIFWRNKINILKNIK